MRTLPWRVPALSKIEPNWLRRTAAQPHPKNSNPMFYVPQTSKLPHLGGSAAQSANRQRNRQARQRANRRREKAAPGKTSNQHLQVEIPSLAQETQSFSCPRVRTARPPPRYSCSTVRLYVLAAQLILLQRPQQGRRLQRLVASHPGSCPTTMHCLQRKFRSSSAATCTWPDWQLFGEPPPIYTGPSLRPKQDEAELVPPPVLPAPSARQTGQERRSAHLRGRIHRTEPASQNREGARQP